MCSFCLKPLPFRGGVGVGGASTLRKTREPTPLRLSSKLASLTAPPLKGRGEYCQTKNWLIHSAISAGLRSEEHTSELQSLMRISYAVFCLKKKNTNTLITGTIRQRTRLNKVHTENTIRNT